MQGKTPQEMVNQMVADLNIDLEAQLSKEYQVPVGDQDNKALKKRFKKTNIDENQTNQKAIEKVNKLLDELTKCFQAAGKQLYKTKQSLSLVKSGQTQRQKANKQKMMFENLYNGFRKKYDEELKIAAKVEQQEEDKRKAKIQELQQRIKVIQAEYEEAGKIKVEKYKENEILKHELSKFQPHLVASESLAEAQLKKKSIQIEIQMTTLKQKIQMMSSFKAMREETQNKMKSGKQLEEKLDKRLKVVNDKEEEHKISLAKAHLVFQDYKKAFNVLKVQLPQKEKDAFLAKDKVKKGVKSLEEIKAKNDTLDKEAQTHTDQLQVLRKLAQQLQAQIQE